MTSECINNKRAIATVIVAGVSGALGLELAYTEGDVAMHDYSDTIEPNNFQPSSNGGWYWDIHSGGAIGWGGSASNTSLGHVFPDDLISGGEIKGGEISVISMTIGSSTLRDVKWEDCCP
jgi:hypothetical protein